ncbi:PAS domain-containing protein [Silvimonas iriomotensis]|uniref:PAS domain-containing protein n=1 Tax=Silvimonas iriomotensis TaxID=449662 RepID=A0ABQ2P602_9NEIS|nr:PAS domain-containing protein [Silvimonas iriomotensis]GGP18877.1 hypothetical protein GCM10010970_07830 [Silvimonas iriomotensis]
MSSSLAPFAGEMLDSSMCSELIARKILESDMACAMVDALGVIVGAGHGLCAILPEAVGQTVDGLFQIEATQLFATRAPVYGMYVNATGELVPVALQVLFYIPEMGGAALVALTDGAAFRAAETRRFEQAPYTVLRVAGGVIRFANHEALRMLGSAQQPLSGRPLVAFFEANEHAVIGEYLALCEQGQRTAPLDVCLDGPDNLPSRHVRLHLMPDIAPSGQILGVLVVIQLAAVEHVRDEIRKIMIRPTSMPDGAVNPPQGSWRVCFGLIVKKLQQLIEFDHAIFGIYSDDVRLFRAVAIEGGSSSAAPPVDQLWPSRWMDLPESMAPWLAAGETFIPDIRIFAEHEDGLRGTDITRQYLDYGIVSSVTLPMKGYKGAISSSLTLCSRQAGRYGAAELALLQELDLEPVLLRFEERLRREHDTVAGQLRNKLATSQNLANTALEIVTDIARHFRWDYVGLFRVNRHTQQFQLVQQYAATEPLRLPPSYEQSMAAGMLARTLRAEKVLVVDEIDSPDCEQYEYIAAGRSLRSAMCIPLRLNRRARWVINVESTSARAFRGPDRDEIMKMVALIEEGLTQRLLAEMKDALLHTSEQGVVVVGLDGVILEMNEVAGKLLGTSVLTPADGDAPVLISRYASGNHPETADILEGRTTQAGRRIELQGDDGVVRAVLATRRELESTFDTAIWLFTDIEKLDWSRDLRFLRTVVSDVAQQTRAPLTLASTLARQLPRLAGHAQPGSDQAPSALVSMTERLIAEIGKADITFERLAEGLSIREVPKRFEERIDLVKCLAQLVKSLPERDQSRVENNWPARPVSVSGDAGRLSYAFRSIIGFLLRRASGDERHLVVWLDDDPQQVTLRLGLSERTMEADATDPPGPRDALWQASRTAMSDASLSLDVITEVIAAHGGQITRQPACWADQQASPPWRMFDITLPRLPEAGDLK